MARRRNWGTGSRIAYGLSQGIQPFLMQMLRDISADKNAARITERQEKADARTLERQQRIQREGHEFTQRQTAFAELPDMVDRLGPDGAETMLAARGVNLFPPEHDENFVGTGERERELAAGQNATRSLVQGLRKPLRRKLEDTVGKHITGASSPEQLGESDIMGQLLAADDRVVPADDEPGMRIGGIRPEAYEYVARAEDKAHALRSKPDQRVSGTNADGSTFEQMVPSYDLATPMQTGPTAAQQGRNAGTTKVEELKTSGNALAAQAGREAYARANADIQAKLDNSKALLQYEFQKSAQELTLIPDRVARTRAAERVADAHETAQKMLPAATQLQTMWLEAVPSITAMNAGRFGAAGLGAAESFQPSSTLPPPVKRYTDFVNAVRPMLARAFGQTGNPALMEQEWAKYVPNYSEALTPDTALEKLARLEALGVGAMDLAKASEHGPLTGKQVDAILQPRVDAALAELRRRAQSMPGAQPATRVDPRSGLEFTVTPTGIQMVRPQQ